MIFATLGSSNLPFERLVRALGTLPPDELIVQHGPVPPPPGVHKASAFMSFSELVENMERADTIVCHAGAGSILCALRAGHTPVVVPRLRRYAETVDDHQIELARALEAEQRVVAVWELGDLADAVASAPRRAPHAELRGPRPLHFAVRAALSA